MTRIELRHNTIESDRTTNTVESKSRMFFSNKTLNLLRSLKSWDAVGVAGVPTIHYQPTRVIMFDVRLIMFKES